jgi:hypothetical protein
MGKQFGLKYKAEIKAFAESRMSRLISFVERYGKIKVTEQEILSLTQNLLAVQQQYDPDGWQEFLGIAEGASITLEWLYILNSYTDLRDYICKIKGLNDKEIRFDGCTGFILDKTMSFDNQIIIGQTWDMSIEAMDYLVIVKKYPDHGPSMIYLTTMGCLALIGLNSNQLAIGTTNLMANDCQIGINYLSTISQALTAASYHEMVDKIINTKRLSGHSFLCADVNNGNLLETSAQNYFDHKLEHFPLVRTNNYGEIMSQHQIYIPEMRQRNSIYRYGRALSILATKAKWTNEDLWQQVLGDCIRSSSGAAICNDDYHGKYSEFATLATVLLIPAQRKMWICRGGVTGSQKQEIVIS